MTRRRGFLSPGVPRAASLTPTLGRLVSGVSCFAELMLFSAGSTFTACVFLIAATYSSSSRRVSRFTLRVSRLSRNKTPTMPHVHVEANVQQDAADVVGVTTYTVHLAGPRG